MRKAEPFTNIEAYLQKQAKEQGMEVKYDDPNGAYLVANSAFAYANSIASSGTSVDGFARDTANAAYNTANASYGQANTGTTLAQAAYNKANTSATFLYTRHLYDILVQKLTNLSYTSLNI